MSFLVAGAIAAGAGVAKAISGGVQKKKAKAAAAAAQAELEAQKDAFKQLDTTNPYQNMENVYEDLTVNQEEAQFVREQQEQQRANILADLRGAAGGSGIAALAQTLANQGSQDARKAAISIGKQEQANQMKERKETARLQGLQREGAIMSRQMEADKTKALMGMAADEFSSARQAVAAADQKMWSGITGAAGAVAGGIKDAGGLGNLLGGTGGGTSGFSTENMEFTSNFDPNQFADDSIYMTPIDPNDPFTSTDPDYLQYADPNQGY